MTLGRFQEFKMGAFVSHSKNLAKRQLQCRFSSVEETRKLEVPCLSLEISLLLSCLFW